MSRADSPLRDRMLFLVGAQRSGTNWLQGMLKLHPDVVALPSETQLLSFGMHVLRQFTQQGPMESWQTARTFMELDRRMAELREEFGLDEEDLNLNLGPLGNLL